MEEEEERWKGRKRRRQRRRKRRRHEEKKEEEERVEEEEIPLVVRYRDISSRSNITFSVAAPLLEYILTLKKWY